MCAFVGALVLGGGPAAGQSPDPSGGPAGSAGLVSLGADTERYRDDFSTADGWGLLDEDAGSIEHEDGALRFRFRADDQSRWSWHDLGEGSPVLRVAITAELDGGAGAAGPMCGSAGDDPSFFVGVVNNAGEWVLARIVGDDLTVIAREAVPGLDLGDGGTVRLELECGVVDGVGDRLGLWVDGVNVADVTDVDSFGPFGRAGLYASAATQPWQASFDDALVLGGETYDPRVVLGPEPTVEPSPAPSASPGTLTTLGATIVEREEPFDDPTIWGTLASDQGTIAYDAGTLDITLRPSNNALWSWLPLVDSVPVLGVETTVFLGAGQGDAGPMCGDAAAASPSFHFASVSTGGRLIVGTIVDRERTVIDRFPIPGGRARPGSPVRVRIECAVVGDGTDRVAVWVDDALVADLIMAGSIGPFGKAAVSAANTRRRWSATFDDLVIRWGAALAPGDAIGARDVTAAGLSPWWRAAGLWL